MRTPVTFAALFLLCSCGPGPTAWPGLALNGEGADEVMDLLITGDQVIVVGYRNGRVGQDRFDPGGNAQAFLGAYDFEGALRWEHVFDTDQTDTLDAVAVSGDTLWAVGRTQGTFPGATQEGQQDVLLISAPLSGGDPTTVAQFGDERPQRPNRLAVDAEGAVLVSGYDEVYVPSNYVEDWENGFTARYRPGGTPGLEWMRRSVAPSTDFLLGMAPTGVAGELFVAGMVLAGAGRGPFVRRERADGSVAWHTQLGSGGLDAATAVTVGPDGRVYVAGATFTRLGTHAFGQQDAFVIILDPETGEQLRGMQAGSVESDWPWDLAIAEDGTVYVAGGTLGAMPGFELAGEQDAFVIRFSPEGDWSGVWQGGSPQFDDALSLALDDRGGVFVGGNSDGAVVEGHAFGGVRDGWLVRIDGAAFQPGAVPESGQ